MRLRILPLLLIPVLFAAGCVVAVDSQGQIVRDEKRFTVSGAPDLRLTTFDGSIEVRTWDRPEVLVEIEKRGASKEALDKLKVSSTQDGNRIELKVQNPARHEMFFGIINHASARFTVTMPRDGNLSAHSGDGSIHVEGVHGRLELRTGDGAVHASRVAGDLTVYTGDGSITLDGADGQLDLETGDGGVDVTGTLKGVKLHSGDGSITFHAQAGSTMADDWSITTGDGGVSVYLPSGFGAQIDAHSGDGAIRSDLSLTAGADGVISKHTVRATLGSGGRVLRIRTGDGSVRLRGGA
ncbi:MAG TPA: DUF4097 family beta strand repeat-containing protein [Vicinamibacterales bacterium]|nr:DUF4097 family beta strand repeat-containing protein [Vicinamibacterales bacterium]